VTIPAEPEIEQVPEDKEIVDMLLREIQELHDLTIAVITLIFQMGIGQEYRFCHPLPSSCVNKI
jgi:hypothetical protein